MVTSDADCWHTYCQEFGLVPHKERGLVDNSARPGELAKSTVDQEWRIWCVATPDARTAFEQAQQRMEALVAKLCEKREAQEGFGLKVESLEQHFCAGPTHFMRARTVADGSAETQVRVLNGVFGTGVESWETQEKAEKKAFAQLPWVALRKVSSRCEDMGRLVRQPSRITHLDGLTALEVTEVTVKESGAVPLPTGMMRRLQHNVWLTIAVEGTPTSIDHAVGKLRLDSLGPHVIPNPEGNALMPLYLMNVSYPRFISIAGDPAAPLVQAGRTRRKESTARGLEHLNTRRISSSNVLSSVLGAGLGLGICRGDISDDQASAILNSYRICTRRLDALHEEEGMSETIKEASAQINVCMRRPSILASGDLLTASATLSGVPSPPRKIDDRRLSAAVIVPYSSEDSKADSASNEMSNQTVQTIWGNFREMKRRLTMPAGGTVEHSPSPDSGLSEAGSNGIATGGR